MEWRPVKGQKTINATKRRIQQINGNPLEYNKFALICVVGQTAKTGGIMNLFSYQVITRFQFIQMQSIRV